MTKISLRLPVVLLAYLTLTNAVKLLFKYVWFSGLSKPQNTNHRNILRIFELLCFFIFWAFILALLAAVERSDCQSKLKCRIYNFQGYQTFLSMTPILPTLSFQLTCDAISRRSSTSNSKYYRRHHQTLEWVVSVTSIESSQTLKYNHRKQVSKVTVPYKVYSASNCLSWS